MNIFVLWYFQSFLPLTPCVLHNFLKPEEEFFCGNNGNNFKWSLFWHRKSALKFYTTIPFMSNFFFQFWMQKEVEAPVSTKIERQHFEVDIHIFYENSWKSGRRSNIIVKNEVSSKYMELCTKEQESAENISFY